MKTVLITGGSGTIGMRLSEILVAKGYIVRHLTRTVNGSEKYPSFVWNIKTGIIDLDAFKAVDHIIHLAGENVGGGRWTEERKKSIYSSRIDTANLIFEKLGNQKIKSFISASGISYYGTKTTEKIFQEADPKGTDFLAEISVSWEKAAQQFEKIANRVVCIRTGVVLSPSGGAIEKIVMPIKFGFGSPLGSGKQYMPWIHLDDICGIYVKSIEDEAMTGNYNAVASVHITNSEMTKSIAQTLKKPLWMPKVPAFALKLLFGEMANIILKGSRIDNAKIKKAGYIFEYDSIQPALENILKK